MNDQAPKPSLASRLYIAGALSLGALLALFISCAPTVYLETEPPGASPWGGKYAMTFNPPEKTPRASVPVTVAVVNPAYKGSELSESALADPVYAKVAKGFSASMGNDLDKILISKGVTTVGPFASRDEITYNEKKGASVILAPHVLLATQIKYQGDFRLVVSGPAGNSVSKGKLERLAYRFGEAYSKSGANSSKIKRLAQEWSVVVTSGMPESVADEWAKKFASGELIVSYEGSGPSGAPSVQKAPPPSGAAVSSGMFGTKTRRTRQGATLATAGSADDASFGLARFERNFTMTTSGWMYFVMQEPLSGEKLWVKKLELDPIEVHGTESYAPDHNITFVNDPCVGQLEIPSGFKPGANLVFDGRGDAMATTVQKMYPIIMQKFETYLDPIEIEQLKLKAKEIREHKVY
ncbi:MAG: hypothetical protein A2V88_11275 [Elusimicrobia bacterium RBG_16_66_12]|nr:MAG: hypothetical protein A2V88_11275 [Elusimicrobia bacterium RBG_16_66_12]